MKIGIAFDLKEDHEAPDGRDDLLEEYDSIDTIRAIQRELEGLGHRVVLLHGGKRFFEKITAEPVDLVFNIAEGSGGRCRESHVPALCELLGVPYTHSDPLALALSLDKSLAVKIAKSSGIPTPFQHVVRTPGEEKLLEPPMPVVVKPLHEGSSMGVFNNSLAKDHGAMRKKVASMLRRYRQPVIVEEFLPGTELTVGVVGNSPPEVLGVMEIAPRKGRPDDFLYSIETKRNFRQLVDYHCPPAGVRERTVVEAGRMALEIYELFGCCDVARIDLRLDGRGRPKFLEINPLPGLSPTYSDLCIMASLQDIPYGRLIERILSAAARRLHLEDGTKKSKKRGKKRQAASPASHPDLGRI